MIEVIYKDVDQSLSKNYLTNGEAVLQSIVNLLRTKKKQRLFRSSVGCSLQDILFEPMSYATELAVYSEVVDVVTKFEPRAILDKAKTNVVADFDNHVYWLTLVFKIVNLPETYTYEIGLKK